MSESIKGQVQVVRSADGISRSRFIYSCENGMFNEPIDVDDKSRLFVRLQQDSKTSKDIFDGEKQTFLDGKQSD